MLVVLDLLHQAERLEVLHDLLPRRLDRHPGVRAAAVVDAAVRREDVDHGQFVAQAARVVVRVVPRRDLHTARAQLRLGQQPVRDDRNRPVHQRQHAVLTDQVLVPLVIRMYRHRRIAQHRLRPRGSDDKIVLADLGVRPGRVMTLDRVAIVPEVALDVLVNDLVVGDGGLEMRIPIHQPFAAIDQPILEPLEEDFVDRLGADVIQREPRPRPIAGEAHLPQLPQNPPAVFLFPFPDLRDQPLAADLVPRDVLLLLKLPLHDGLGRDAGVVRARHPQRLEATHPVSPNEHVLERLIDRVPEVQRPGHVRQRNVDHVRPLVGVRLGPEAAALLPQPVNVALDRLRIVGSTVAHNDSGRIRGPFMRSHKAPGPPTRNPPARRAGSNRLVYRSQPPRKRASAL